ncbi:MAG: hypothetical protein VX796_05975 [Pseudomonadota bacterium]|nr:hypothetical protein [Pseudomonadota bacterium]
MIDRIASLIGQYVGGEFIESRTHLIRAANAALDYEKSCNLGHMRYCRQLLTNALVRVPYQYRKTAEEQIRPLIDEIDNEYLEV